MLSDEEKKILRNFLVLTEAEVARWAGLLKESLSFTAREKGIFILDFSAYTSEQKRQFIDFLLKEKARFKNLRQKHPKHFQQKQQERARAWSFMLAQLRKFTEEKNIGKIKKLIRETN